MKIKRFIALAALAIVVTVTMSAFAMNAFAQTTEPTAPAAVIQGCDSQDDSAAEAAETGPDLDDVEEECGPQDEAEDGTEAADDDDVQDEFESQADDALETETVEAGK